MASYVELTVPRSNKKVKVPTGLFINNEFVPSVGGADPITCRPIRWSIALRA
jgi:aldehyde dehydrogenase (NAD+)